MKRKLAAILVVLMGLSMISLTGCHEKYDLEALAREEAEAQAKKEAEKEAAEAAENGEDGENTEGEAGDTEEAQEAEEETVPGVPPSDILGKTNANSYSNAYFGIKYTKPNDDWYLATQKELGEIMGMTSSTIKDENILSLLESSGFVMDFYAINANVPDDNSSFDSVNITIEDIGKMYGVLMSDKDLADSNVEVSKKALEAQGWKNVNMEVGEIVFAGVPRVCITSSAENGKLKMFQRQIYLKKESYLACVTVGTFGSDKTDSVLKAFSQL